jgi:hypothetical protein
MHANYWSSCRIARRCVILSLFPLVWICSLLFTFALAGELDEIGGSLVLKPKDCPQQVFLTPGGAVLFEATTVEHETMPLLCTEQEPSPKRIVAIALLC